MRLLAPTAHLCNATADFSQRLRSKPFPKLDRRRTVSAHLIDASRAPPGVLVVLKASTEAAPVVVHRGSPATLRRVRLRERLRRDRLLLLLALPGMVLLLVF